MSNMETKKTEVRFKTSDIEKMQGMYLAEDLYRRYSEDFVDEDTGQIVSVERSELLFKRGELIQGDISSQILFYLQTKEISEVAVSNQCRKAFELNITGLTPWKVQGMVVGLKKTIFLYANGIKQALEIAKDYVELNMNGYFVFTKASGFADCTFIPDTLRPADMAGKPIGSTFYIIDAVFKYASMEEEEGEERSFLVRCSDVEKCKAIINAQVTTELSKVYGKAVPPFILTINEARKVKCTDVVDLAFSMAYVEGGEE